jgi:hypothetical protein
MKSENENVVTRKEFLKRAAAISGIVIAAGGGFSVYKLLDNKDPVPDKFIRLNPAFRINQISDTDIELYTHLENMEKLSHYFSGFEASLLLEINKEQKLNDVINAMVQKYAISKDECMKRIKDPIKELEEAKLIYYGDKMLVKIVETTNVE